MTKRIKNLEKEKVVEMTKRIKNLEKEKVVLNKVREMVKCFKDETAMTSKMKYLKYKSKYLHLQYVLTSMKN